MFGRGDRDVTARMLDTLRHRGPDDAHIEHRPRFAIGARRLSILDVAGGRQPMTNERRTVFAAENGELYNYPVVRPELEQRGHVFTTHCDTELLPHLYEECGAELPGRIDGMFAVAVWDDERQVGLLARDRMGKKPLYYWHRGDVLYFASELKALLTVPGFTRTINFEALDHFLSLKHVPHPLTIFKDVYMLPPAHRLTFEPGKPPVISRYWDVDFRVDSSMESASIDELTDELVRLLRQGVKRRLLSDVPIGFFLSGGLDSSLSTVLAAEAAGDRIKTFTLTYGDGSTTAGKEQDRRWARWVAERYATEHHEETIAFGSFPENLRRILRSFDEPFAGVLSSYLLSQLIAQHVKVALSGDGADELFGSYLSHRLAQPLANYLEYVRTGDSSLIAGFESRPEYLAGLLADGASDGAWRGKLLVYSDCAKRKLYAPDVAASLSGVSTEKLIADIFAGAQSNDPLNRVLEAEFKTIFPDQVLTYGDRLSMAHSLEVRTAYLDTDLVQFVAKLPGSVKIRGGVTKFLLKEAARRYFPDEMVNRPKEGFLMPVTPWFQNDLEPYVRATLSAERLERHGIFQQPEVAAVVDKLYSPNSDYHDVNRVLALVVFQEWYDLYMS